MSYFKPLLSCSEAEVRTGGSIFAVEDEYCRECHTKEVPSFVDEVQ
jgi:hypothetical protein